MGIENVSTVNLEDYKTAINKHLADALVYDGKVNLELMDRTQIDYAIELLRRFRAFTFGKPTP